MAAERLPELLALHPDAVPEPPIAAPAARAGRAWTREAALLELLRGRVTVLGPTTAPELARPLRVGDAAVDAALLALEAEGLILRGAFSAGAGAGGPQGPPRQDQPQQGPSVQWCDRRLLARIHRYTLNRLRAEIAAVTPADFMRHLFAWQHVAPPSRLAGAEGLRAVITQLDGLELPARSWERDVLPARVQDYQPGLLDMLCLTGGVTWARLSSGPTQVVGATPIALLLREQADAWAALGSEPGTVHTMAATLAGDESLVLEDLRLRGASFRHEIGARCGLSDDRLRAALGQLVAQGLVSSDGFAGLRAIVAGRPPDARGRGGPDLSGRWFARVSAGGSNQDPPSAAAGMHRDAAIEALAWTLLRRYGVVFRRLLAREGDQRAWRELARVYRRLEARGEIRGGRFVSGMSGEQFALPEAVEHLREIRRSRADDQLITISAADPLNLTGIITPGDRLRTAAGNRIVYRNGVPLAALEGDMLRVLGDSDPVTAAAAAAAAAGRRVPVISGYVGRVG